MAENGCRAALKRLATGAPSNPGLAFQRYLEVVETGGGDKPALLDLLKGIETAAPTKVYERAYERWKEHISTIVGARNWTGALSSPLAIGLGSASPVEVGLTVHHTYGMPLIPGSALKGMCRRAARMLKADGKLGADEETLLFGSEDANHASAGYITFWDAWLVPAGAPFTRDTVTVHHPKYYSGENAWPTDFDDPIPVPFVAIAPAQEFLFAVSAPSDSWADYVRELLKYALVELGAGAKTNAGYGRFRTDSWQDAQPKGGKEVWLDCRIKQVGGGTPTATVLCDAGQAAIPNKPWLELRGKLTPDEREAAKSGKLVKSVAIERIGNSVHVLDWEIA